MMTHNLIRWAGAGLLLGCLATVEAADGNVYENEAVGIRIAKPEGWHFLTAEAVAANLATPLLREESLEKLIRSNPSVPLLVIARYPEPHQGLNPSVQVSFKTQGELMGKGAVALLSRIVERLQANFTTFDMVQPVTQTTVDGQPAAKMVAQYTVTDAKGSHFRTLAHMWVVPRGEYMITVSMYGAPEGPETCVEEFQAALNSIKLTKP